MKMRLQYPVYPDLTIDNGGFLPNDNRAFALWYYYTLAQQVFEKVGDSTEDQFGLLETDPWLDAHYERIARSVAFVYSFKDPGEFFEQRFWDCVKQQAEAMGYPTPKPKYMRPVRIALIS
jgi:hypothetical protein